MTEVGLWHYAYVNPGTPEFSGISPENLVPFLPLEAIWPHGTADYSLTIEAGSGSSYTQFRKGDVLVPKVTPTVFHGRAMVTEVSTSVGLATSEVHVLRARHNADPRWLMYQMLTNRFLDRARGNITGVAGLQRISTQYLESYKVHCTDLETQRRIADYLDEEVREMDALIADLEELVKNLECRSVAKAEALVNASNFDSLTLGLISDIKIGKMLASSSNEAGDNLPYLRAAHIQPAGLLDLGVEEKRMEFSATERQSFSLRKGDILIVEGGAGYGRSVLLSEDLPNMGFQNSVNRVRVKESMADAKFVYYMLQSAKNNGRIDMVCDTATIPHFTSEKVSRFRIPVPPLERQRAIADELDRETAETDFLIKEATELIENLKARKTALITEVVTGRKKV